MKLFVLILNHIEKLDDLMVAFAKENIKGATIFDSTGMARELSDSGYREEEIPFLVSLRGYLNYDDGRKNKTILTVIRDDQQETIIKTTKEVVGDFSEPDTGIMFILPLDYVVGRGQEK
ncbi:MAG TPA: hypothetical protein VFD08_06185 [Clostridia bacterium]|nr:hypothetical protein [Clostridia bacterium]